MPSTSVSSSESNATEGATLEFVPGREYARCWFDVVGGQYRPITQATVRHALFRTRNTNGTYDWSKGTATWSFG